MKRNLMLSNRTLVKNVIACASIAAGVMFPLSSNAETTITAVLEAPLRALDPIVSTAYIIRNYGYMVYDTVLAEDAKGMPRPQMADWKVENGGKTYVFTLRDGLKFHDGKPVTATDTVASLKRWMQLDKMGQMLDGIMVNMKVVNDKTFSIELKQATDLPLRAMAKPSAVPAFVMPAAVAATPTSELITTSIGSGPFKFIASEYKPGVQAVFEKNKDYVPRAEAPDGMAGGKVVKVDKVKWVAMPDAMTALNALKAGEVDMVEQVAIDLLPMLENDKNLNLIPSSLRGGQTIMRFNFTLPGFDNKLVRQAAMMAVNQDSMMRAQIGDPKYYRTCGAVFGCDSKIASHAGAEEYFKGNTAKAKELLAQSGYKGETIVVMHPTDVQVGQVVPVIAQQLRNAGFKVRVDAVDWQTQQTRRASKRPVADGGWNIFVTYSSMPDVANPLGYPPVAANGDKAWFGWPVNPAVEDARKGYAIAANEAEVTKYAVELQKLLVDDGIVSPLGEYTIVSALNKSVKGFMNTPVPVFWNVSK
jgi:peptide/nickel transport system substrate-binding protein